ncbi:MAG: cell division protein ZapA [Desulfobacterota bacterium]|nr:cell division protein ZapA [Thermodesulfobacteriota bacterium]MDW8001062.1 cell division protein ZapA [Deltaproteobacteria bacterium]
MGKRVEVTIGNQLYTFVGDDEERIKRAAVLVDNKLSEVIKEHGIVNTVNALIMTLMEMADEYLSLKERIDRIEVSTNRLLKKMEEV